MSGMGATTYVAFVETNDWADKTWTFYIPVEGNKRALTRLKMHLDNQGGHADSYALYDKVYSEEQVDALCAREALIPDEDDGYPPAHSKLSGLLDIEELMFEEGEMLDQVLYKGGIRNYMISS